MFVIKRFSLPVDFIQFYEVFNLLDFVLDSILRILAGVLAPLSQPQGSLLAVSTDLSLLGWILLYLSLLLDNTTKSDTPVGKRWNWLTGESNIKATGHDVTTGNHRRKFHRRFIHYKQQIDQLDWTKKAVQASTQVQVCTKVY